MPLSWNEIKDRAFNFARDWAEAKAEIADAKSFLDAFFEVFGVPRRRVATFETKVAKAEGRDGRIDLLWKGILLVEMKSRGKDLDRALQQAKDYFPGIKDRDVPCYIMVSDFAQIRLYDLEENAVVEFALVDFYKHVQAFGFIAGYQTRHYGQEDPINIKACERLGLLHDALVELGYVGHELEVHLVRLLFCLFADDTSIFTPRGAFRDWVELRTAEDGSNLAPMLCHLFQILNTPENKRLKGLDEQLAAFPYINGQIFAETLPVAAFTSEMRSLLLEAAALDWSRISPAIFGSLFQSVMLPKERRQLGAHYTTETNILKLIGPLFLDELRAEFERAKAKPKQLFALQQKLAKLKFFDPACGCGNFLVIAYRELRLLELDILKLLYGNSNRSLDVGELNVLCDVDQFYGIEQEEFPAQIARTALWLMDHQMNLLVSEHFGMYYNRLPLTKAATIAHGNALQLDWRTVCPQADFILGNPPFIGKTYRSVAQNADMDLVFKGIKKYRSLDYVTCWYRKATAYMLTTPSTRCAFVSTNSITQGEQVGALWPDLLAQGVKIHFAHQTFQWTSEASGKAAVHCVIIGFGVQDVASKLLFTYKTPQSSPSANIVDYINPYLIAAAPVIVKARATPICKVSPMVHGSIPVDGGNLLLSTEDKAALLAKEPQAAPWIRPLLGADEFINGKERWCLWFVGIQPQELRAMPEVMQRVMAAKEMRLASKKDVTVERAATAFLFAENRQPQSGHYILVPRVSSERRTYIPMGFIDSNIISTDANQMIPNATMYEFGVLESAMHMAWMRVVAGRLKSDYRYSATIVYNNFPWPDPNPKQQAAITTAAHKVLDTRAKYPSATLADLYDPATMPVDLLQAHRRLDLAVDAAYSKHKFTDDAARVTLLFELYQKLTRQ